MSKKYITLQYRHDDHKSLKSFCKLFVCSLCVCCAEDDKESLIEHFKSEHADIARKLKVEEKKLPTKGSYYFYIIGQLVENYKGIFLCCFFKFRIKLRI